LSVIPSFFKYTDLFSGVLTLKLLAFFLVFMLIGAAVTDFKKIKLILNTFLFFSLANAVHLILMAVLTGRRVFGFAGIMFVDYAGIAIVISLLFFLYNKKFRWLYFGVFLVVAVSLILTQTRNAWISSGLLIFFIMVQFYFKGRKISAESINKFLMIIVMFIAVLTVGIQALTFNPKAFERVQTMNRETNQKATEVSDLNTLATRVFIWHTSWNAFKENPYTGVGLYNFQFVSKEYYSIDYRLYKDFVEGLSPHQTHIEILTETGLIGLTGFLIFLGAILLFAEKNIRLSRNKSEIFYSNLIFWLFMYILVSMMMTDAWLWGHGLILWGIVVGLIISMRKQIKNNLLQATEQV
jgi:O-antigen ligase